MGRKQLTVTPLTPCQRQLVEDNIRLVGHAIKLLRSRRSILDRLGDYEDICQHGYTILCRAAQHFDAKQGIKFSTYAMCSLLRQLPRDANGGNAEKQNQREELREYWENLISPQISSTVDDTDHVRHLLTFVPRRRRVLLRLKYGIGGDPEMSESELAEVFGISRACVWEMLKLSKESIRRKVGT